MIRTEANRRTPIDRDAPCLLWEGDCNDNGYGRVMVGGQTHYVHRLSYQLHVGPLNRGEEVDHLCRVHNCYEPRHLEGVSSRENTLRGNHPLIVIRRAQMCSRGHDLTNPAHVYVRPDGRRRCRTCSLMTQTERRRAAQPCER